MKSRMSKPWDLYIEPVPRSGAWNMAVDEHLFNSLGPEPKTLLRFYSWERPTVSLGYSQKVDSVLDLDRCRLMGIDVVRRLTGGKVVLHHREVTYSLCSSDVSLFSTAVTDSYRKISEALILGLKKMDLNPRLADPAPEIYRKGNLPCFSYPAENEIEIDGKKIIGSAQKRVGNLFLQHGSLPLEDDAGRLLRDVSFLTGRDENIRMISLSTALGRTVTFEEAIPYLQTGYREYFQVELAPRIFTDKDRAAILRLQHDRYDSPDWTLERH